MEGAEITSICLLYIDDVVASVIDPSEARAFCSSQKARCPYSGISGGCRKIARHYSTALVGGSFGSKVVSLQCLWDSLVCSG